MRCLGVTGTNAKTSTTYLLEAIAIAAGETAGLVGTTGARIADESVAIDFTTPEATELQALLARMRDVGVHTVALEVSSHALAQHRVDGTWFAAACFTNLSHDHLDFHQDVDAYFAAKLRLFEPERCGVAVTNVDDPYGRDSRGARASERGLGVFTYALDDPRPTSGPSRFRSRPTDPGSCWSTDVRAAASMYTSRCSGGSTWRMRWPPPRWNGRQGARSPGSPMVWRTRR